MGRDSAKFYWATHMALVPSAIEPSKLRVTIGDNFEGTDAEANNNARVFGVTGDWPEFNTITQNSGPTAYELQWLLPCDGSSITVRSRARNFLCNTEAVGMLLIELLDDQRMRVELFSASSPESELAFTENARIYIR